jgi:hypothetical protein
MTKMTPRYKKTTLGHMHDARQAVKRIETTAGEWCKAFDAGDLAAVNDLSVVMLEAYQDACDAIKRAGGQG